MESCRSVRLSPPLLKTQKFTKKTFVASYLAVRWPAFVDANFDGDDGGVRFVREPRPTVEQRVVLEDFSGILPEESVHVDEYRVVVCVRYRQCRSPRVERRKPNVEVVSA